MNKNVKVDVLDDNRNTAVHLAVEETLGNVKILELLTNHGENINNINKDGKSLLHLSIEKGYYTL